jgi:hypothetical protein
MDVEVKDQYVQWLEVKEEDPFSSDSHLISEADSDNFGFRNNTPPTYDAQLGNGSTGAIGSAVGGRNGVVHEPKRAKKRSRKDQESNNEMDLSGSISRPPKVSFSEEQLLNIFSGAANFRNPEIVTVAQSVQQLLATINLDLPGLFNNRVSLQPKIANYISQISAFSSNLYCFPFIE